MIYGKDIFDSVYALVGKFFEKQYKDEHSVIGDVSNGEQILIPASESEADSEETLESTNIPNVSVMKEEIFSDIEARLPFILASACCDLFELDGRYRVARGQAKEKESYDEVFASLDEPFPLSDAFVQPCVLYCASMLLIDLDPDRSDVLFERYADAISRISSSLPALCEEIKEKY